MLIETVPISSLSADPANLRKHDERNLNAVKASLRRFGQQKPIVVSHANVVIAGNCTLAAAMELGWKEITITRSSLAGSDAVAYAIADNRTAELGTWDDAALAAVLSQMEKDEELIGVGFDDRDLAALLSSIEADDGNDFSDPGEVKREERAVSKTGDLWLLGEDRHRLLCGDASKAENVSRLMRYGKAGLFCTDPPYGVDFVAAKDGIPASGFSDHSERWKNIAGDDLRDAKLQEFLESVFRACLSHLENAAWYLWHAHLTQGFFSAAAAAAAANVLLHRQIIWKKPGFVLTRSGQYHWAHEPCFYGWVKGKEPRWLGERNQTSVWEISRDGVKEHPTQKPIELFEIPILNHLLPGEIALEPFCGSGSQILAAEKLGRRCYAMEIDPGFVDLTIRRWEIATGKSAILEGDGRAFSVISEVRKKAELECAQPLTTG